MPVVVSRSACLLALISAVVAILAGFEGRAGMVAFSNWLSASDLGRVWRGRRSQRRKG